MNDIKDTITGITRTVTKTSSGFIKTAKLRVSLANEESNLKSVYMEIGKKVHEIYTYGGSLGKVFDDKYKEILEIEEKINILRNQIDFEKGTKTCPHCSKTASKESDFCPKCGKNMTEAVASQSQFQPTSESEYKNKDKEAQQPYTEPAPPLESKACPACKYENDMKEKICLSCGRIL